MRPSTRSKTPIPRRAGAIGRHPNITLRNYAHPLGLRDHGQYRSIGRAGVRGLRPPHNLRYVQVPAAAGAAPPRSPGARTLKGAAAPRSSDERLMVKPLMMHCRASHTVPMLCIVENPSRKLNPLMGKTVHRGVAARCRGASEKTRLQAMMPSGKNARRATTARQSPLLPQTTLQEVTVTATRPQNGCPDGTTAVGVSAGVGAPGIMNCLTRDEANAYFASQITALKFGLTAIAPELGPRGSIIGRTRLGGSSILNINSNDYLRFGWGWVGTASNGQNVLRISGDFLDWVTGEEGTHINLWPPSTW
jgi:hypothetical protein